MNVFAGEYAGIAVYEDNPTLNTVHKTIGGAGFEGGVWVGRYLRSQISKVEMETEIITTSNVPALIYVGPENNSPFVLQEFLQSADALQGILNRHTGSHYVGRSVGKNTYRTDHYLGNKNIYMVRSIIHAPNSSIFDVIPAASLGRLEKQMGRTMIPAELCNPVVIPEEFDTTKIDEIKWSF